MSRLESRLAGKIARPTGTGPRRTCLTPPQNATKRSQFGLPGGSASVGECGETKPILTRDGLNVGEGGRPGGLSYAQGPHCLAPPDWRAARLAAPRPAAGEGVGAPRKKLSAL